MSTKKTNTVKEYKFGMLVRINNLPGIGYKCDTTGALKPHFLNEDLNAAYPINFPSLTKLVKEFHDNLYKLCGNVQFIKEVSKAINTFEKLETKKSTN